MSVATDTVWGALAPWAPETIPQMVFRSADLHGDRPALVTRQRTVSYAQLGDEVRRWARALDGLGVERGDKVACWLPNSVEWLAVNVATMALGAISVPLNTRFRTREARHVLGSADASVLVTTEAFMTNRYLEMLDELVDADATLGDNGGLSARLPALRHVVTLTGARRWAHDADELVGQQPGRFPELAARVQAGCPEDAANMFWTSGTTGLPKGAVTPHMALRNIFNYTQILEVSPEDRLLVPTPFFYTTAYYWCVLVALMRGARAVALQDFTAREALDTITRERVTMTVGIPNTFLGYLRHLDSAAGRDVDVSTLRLAWVGGAAIPPGLFPRLKERMGIGALVQVYGMTETAGITSMTHPDDPPEIAELDMGHALPGLELRLVDPVSERDVALGDAGELWVRSDMSLLTYYGMPEPELEQYFRPGGWYRTGDILRRGRDGRYAFITRLKDVLKVGGENVTASEIEATIYEHPAVQEVAVVALPDAISLEVPVAVILCAHGPVPTKDDIVEHCRRRLAPFKVPRHVLFVDEIPHTPTGKIRKAEVKEHVHAQLLGTSG